MEKGPSTYAEYWTSEYAEVNHFYAHGYDMGYTYITDYSQAAINFALKKGDNIISFTANEKKFHSTYKYDVETNEFIIISRDGKIVTYYLPEDGIDYFYSQFDKYGDYWN